VILAVETSCDDTCAAVVADDGTLRSNVIASQHAHDRFGGVVPEIAARHHLEVIDAVIARALEEGGIGLDDVRLVAATRGPGLLGALLVGLSAAKGLAAARELPFAAVDHLQGHVAANFLAPDPCEPPFLCLIASGGHTLLARVSDHERFETLGSTLDDAAGEAVDKGARMLGLGYPGGPALERLAAEGDPAAFAFPEVGRGGSARFAASLDFSFAGLKTALLYRIRDLGEQVAQQRRADLAASFQAAVVEALARRVEQGLRATGLQRLAIGGGVAANGPLRERLARIGVPLFVPSRALCTDNAGMIGSAARFQTPMAYPDYLALDAFATGERPQ
jgi:N6-L-threonylcarbamoyladenine synthase